MKSVINALLLLSIFFLMNSCVSVGVDVSTPTDSEEIIDEWDIESFEVTIETITTVQGNISNEETTEITGTQLSVPGYSITFDETDFSARGQYNLSTNSNINGNTTQNTRTYINVSEDGTYSLNEQDLTITFEQFPFEVSINNVDLEFLQEEQIMTYEFDQSGDLILTQDQVFEMTLGSMTTTTTITSRSICAN